MLLVLPTDDSGSSSSGRVNDEIDASGLRLRRTMAESHEVDHRRRPYRARRGVGRHGALPARQRAAAAATAVAGAGPVALCGEHEEAVAEAGGSSMAGQPPAPMPSRTSDTKLQSGRQHEETAAVRENRGGDVDGLGVNTLRAPQCCLLFLFLFLFLFFLPRRPDKWAH